MSALTKIGIVLLVIASLLLSAGVVVFVNRVEDFRKTAGIAEERYKREQELHRDTRAQLDAAVAERLSQAKDFNNRISALNKDIATRDTQIQEGKTQLVKLDQDKKGVEVALQTAMQTQQGLQGQLAAAQTQITDLRGIRDKLVDERHSLNVQLTDSLAKVEALTRARQAAEERAAGLRAQLSDLETKVANAGFSMATLPQRTTAGTAAVEGVVNSVFNAGGKPWASISLGSKDNVTKDMKFNVINDREFLGYLIIQNAEPNEAAGVLEGPKVNQIKPGDHVRTQLQ